MRPYQKPPMEAAVQPATEMMGRPTQRPPLGHPMMMNSNMRGPPPLYKSRPPMTLQASSPGFSSYPVPAPRSGPSPSPGGSAMMMQKLAKPTARYHPSLSGSETDVSTSTENLTQEEKFVLRHMERQEPQGEENGDVPMTSTGASSIASTPLPTFTNMHISPLELQMQLHSRNLQRDRDLRGSRIPGMHPGGPGSVPMTSLDSHNIFPSLPRSLHEELLSQQQAKLRGLGVSAGSPMLSPMIANSSSEMSKLTPSVYSHPTAVQDPVLSKNSDFNNYRGRSPLEVTSSGAFFDHRAIPKGNGGNSDNIGGSSNSSTDIIAKLTKEMMMSDAISVTSSASGSSQQNNANAAQSIINKLNLSPAKSSKVDLNSADKDLATLRSTLAARKAASVATVNQSQGLHQNQRLSLVGTNLDKLRNASSNEALSRSQPDLFTGIDQSNPQSPSEDKKNPVYANTKELASELMAAAAAAASSSSTMSAYDLHQMETLRAENEKLHHQMNEFAKKIARVSSLEQEMAKIHQAYQSLLKHSEKREMLEKSARAKLQAVIISLSDANKEVTERHEAVMSQLMSGEAKNQNIPGLDSILRGEILRKDGLIRQLMDQNKMLLNTKERQEVEMAALNETLEEQRAHIQILDSALSNAQTAVLRLEEENRLKEGYADRVKQMTRSLDQLQKASEKREAMEKKLRAKLEEELKEHREALKGNVDPNNQRSGDSLEDLRRKLSEFEEKVIRLESERTQWEQRYLEETAMRQVAIDAAAIPKDAKIAALEKTSAESEKMIADARSDKMKQFEEMQNAQRKCAEMETAIKSLETTLAERNAMVRILQSKNSASNLAVNNLEDFIASKMAATSPGTINENVLNIAIANSSPHKKQQQHMQQQQQQLHQQFSMPSVLATPPQYHSLNLSKKLGHTHRSLTPSGDMFLKSAQGQEQLMRSVTPSAEFLSSLRAPPSHTELMRSDFVRATPTSAELHRLSAPAEMLRATPTSMSELLRATPTSMADMMRATPTSVAEMQLRVSAANEMLMRSAAVTPSHYDMMRATPTSDSMYVVNPSLKRREPSGTSAAEAFQHPGPTLINTADLYNPSLVGGTMPKMSMLRDHKSPLSNRHQISATSAGNTSSSFLDDSIGSFLGPVTSSSSSNIRHEATKSYDGSKSYMEVWRV